LLQSAKLNLGNVTEESHGEKNLLVPTADNVDEPGNRRVDVTVR
jgi:outer membrane protein OmpA-like peptidoglycan-associated protein